MKYVPVLFLPSDDQKISLNAIDLKNHMEKEGFTDLYVIDELGIKKNKPHYKFYQRFSTLFDLWVDTGPRDIGDVVDDIFSGTKIIIIRLDLWTENSLKSIREVTDHEIYVAIDLNSISSLYESRLFFDEADGVVLFVTDNNTLRFKLESDINQLIKDTSVYVFDMEKNEHIWSSKDIKGFLRDINHYL
ncbi:hypothetical protein B6U98_03390 [Thermoplasmatales archaeon ex4572_165]|nr:MAG: hypothetical protein B6U98_03390 [Thermoplasmatales archaeon ex4572_165]RLF59344.1 MAG: hypothetical protein DRN27_02950 [Thermoplasmata archaeon]